MYLPIALLNWSLLAFAMAHTLYDVRCSILSGISSFSGCRKFLFSIYPAKDGPPFCMMLLEEVFVGPLSLAPFEGYWTVNWSLVKLPVWRSHGYYSSLNWVAKFVVMHKVWE